ncbi:hypothetical protein [Methanosarcina acetivorans]|nr:hypothetical protein [Methanosarcina acetivorans]
MTEETVVITFTDCYIGFGARDRAGDNYSGRGTAGGKNFVK